MAEINDAYAALTREGARDGRTARAVPGPGHGRAAAARWAAAAATDPTRDGPRGHDRHLPAAQPDDRRRASDAQRPPAAPRRARHRSRRAPPRRPVRSSAAGSATSADRRRPGSSGARGTIEFGKFHGHTLGQIAAFEPSYIDWVAGTVTRDPELVAAARVVQADLDARGVARRSHPVPARPSRSA